MKNDFWYEYTLHIVSRDRERLDGFLGEVMGKGGILGTDRECTASYGKVREDGGLHTIEVSGVIMGGIYGWIDIESRCRALGVAVEAWARSEEDCSQWHLVIGKWGSSLASTTWCVEAIEDDSCGEIIRESGGYPDFGEFTKASWLCWG